MKPGDFFIGVVDLFSIIIPGSIATYLILASREFIPPGYAHLGELNKLDDTAKAAAFLIAAFILGNVLFALSSLVDRVYDRTYREWYAAALAPLKQAAGAIQKERAPIPSPDLLRWCVCYLLVNSEPSTKEISALEGTSKFFRSLGTVFLFVAFFDVLAVFSREDHGCLSAAVSLLAAILCLWRYAFLRFKYTGLAYLLVAHVAAKGNSAPQGDKSESKPG